MFEVTQPIFEKIKGHVPKVQELKDAPLWIAKQPEPRLLHECLNANVFDHVVDWKKFVKSMTLFTKNPYWKLDCGENPTEYLKIRDVIAAHLSDEDKAKLGSLESRRYSFASWALWNAPSNKGKMYLPVSAVKAYITRNNLDLEDFYAHTRKHIGGAKGVLISADLYEAEMRIENFLKNAKSFGIPAPHLPNFDAVQNEAIKNMFALPFSALSGSAGCGKTSVTSAFIQALISDENSPTVFCLAFTHKAKRCVMDKLANSGIGPDNTRVRVSTIHSFIATYNRDGGMMPPCYILIDESSMIDIELLAELANTVMTRCVHYQLAFIGDKLQLPPITRGEFYRHLVESPDARHVNELTKCYRTDKPDLFDAYQAIRGGRLPNSTQNFKIITVDNDKEINSQVGKMINKYTHELQDTIQFIAWQNKDVYKINQWVQSALLKAGKIGPQHYKGFYVNDKVIYRGENTKTLTNAMTGRVTNVSARSMTVLWEDGILSEVTGEASKAIQLSYALTVHCLQGSECERVIVACYEVSKMAYCLDRRFLYTGVSRGKQEVIVITTPNIANFLSEEVKRAPLTSITIPTL